MSLPGGQRRLRLQAPGEGPQDVERGRDGDVGRRLQGAGCRPRRPSLFFLNPS